MIAEDVTKVCTKCRRDLPLSAYGKHPNGKHGRQAACKECDSARGKQYLQAPDKLARRKETQSQWYKDNKPAVQQQKAESYRTRRARHLVWSAATRAKRKGIAFSLTDGDVAEVQRRIDAGCCEITGTPFDLSSGRHFNSPSIDRIDSTRGYSSDNIRVVCYAMNAAMNEWGEGVLLQVVTSWLAKRAAV